MKLDTWNNTIIINGKARSLHRIEMIMFILSMIVYFSWFMSGGAYSEAEQSHYIADESIPRVQEPEPSYNEELHHPSVTEEEKPNIAKVLSDIDQTEYDVYTELRKEFTHEVSVAIMGNIYQESRMDSYSDVGSRGLFQWEGGRLTRFISWADANGYDYHDHRIQIKYMIREMNTHDIDERLKGRISPDNLSEMEVSPLYGGYEEFKQLKDVDLATRLFQAVYERAGSPKIHDRIRYAHHYNDAMR